MYRIRVLFSVLLLIALLAASAASAQEASAQEATAQEATAQEATAQEATAGDGGETDSERAESDADDPGSASGLRVGIKAGASLTTLRGELTFEQIGAVGFQADWGFDAGITFELPVSFRFSIQPEVHLVRKHSELDLGVDKNTLRSKLSVNYVELPLLLKFYPGDRSGLSTNFVVGPAASIKTEARRETRAGGEIVDDPAGDLVKELDWGLIFGVGFEFHELFGALTLDIRYNHGLTSIDAAAESTNAKWSALYMLIGVTF